MGSDEDDIAEILKPPEEFADFMEEDNNLTVVRILKIIMAIEIRHGELDGRIIKNT